MQGESGPSEEGAAPAPDLSGCNHLSPMGCDRPMGLQRLSPEGARVRQGSARDGVQRFELDLGKSHSPAWFVFGTVGGDMSLAGLMRLGVCDIFMTPSQAISSKFLVLN